MTRSEYAQIHFTSGHLQAVHFAKNSRATITGGPPHYGPREAPQALAGNFELDTSRSVTRPNPFV